MGFVQVRVYPADGSSNGELSLRLGVHLPESYPSASCPVAELHAPWLSENSRRRVVESFTGLYEESVGEVVVFRWVEWLKVVNSLLCFLIYCAIGKYPIYSAYDILIFSFTGTGLVVGRSQELGAGACSPS
jgi:hypothetical protein